MSRCIHEKVCRFVREVPCDLLEMCRFSDKKRNDNEDKPKRKYRKTTNGDNERRLDHTSDADVVIARRTLQQAKFQNRLTDSEAPIVNQVMGKHVKSLSNDERETVVGAVNARRGF